LAQALVKHLATTGVERGLIGPRETPRLWSRHVLNCAVIGELVPEGARVLDIGSGAGLPGLPLAIARPDLRVVLVEPMLRRTTWLLEVVEALGLDVSVVRSRAQDLHGRERAGVVTSRAVAHLDRLAQWCLPLVDAGGHMVAIKGATAAREIVEAEPTIRRLGGISTELVHCGTASLKLGTTVVRVTTRP